MSDAFISPGPFASKINFFCASELLFKASDLTFKTISITVDDAYLSFYEVGLPIFEKYNIPVIEGISVAVKFAESFIDLDLKTSSRNSFAMPRSKKFTGIFKNFEVYLKWNDSFIYTVTAAHLAKRLGGAKKYKHNNPSDILDLESMIKLQNVLRSKGYDVGKVDGILGAKTRQAVRLVQLEFGLSADSWPTKELLRKLQ